MTPEGWFQELAAAIPGLDASVRDGEREALLDLARIAAHASERWTAPVTTFLLGVALAGQPAADREGQLRALVDRLEPADG